MVLGVPLPHPLLALGEGAASIQECGSSLEVRLSRLGHFLFWFLDLFASRPAFAPVTDEATDVPLELIAGKVPSDLDGIFVRHVFCVVSSVFANQYGREPCS